MLQDKDPLQKTKTKGKRIRWSKRRRKSFVTIITLNLRGGKQFLLQCQRHHKKEPYLEGLPSSFWEYYMTIAWEGGETTHK